MNIDDKRLGILMILVKLNVLGVRRLSYSMTHHMINGAFKEPPCSIPMAIVSMNREFLQFVPKSRYKNEDWVLI
jgi:hypothetical protein